jgi:hypothetical protein
MKMAICNSCGGVIGRDCFNPEECAWISLQQQQEQDKMNDPGCTLMKCTDYKDGVCMFDSPVCKYRQDELDPDEMNELRVENERLRDALQGLMDLNISGIKYGASAKKAWDAALEALSAQTTDTPDRAGDYKENKHGNLS